jgi:hypothetical protein
MTSATQYCQYFKRWPAAFATFVFLISSPCHGRIRIPGEAFECSTSFASSGYPLSKQGATVRLVLLEHDPFLCMLNTNSLVGHRIRNYTEANARFVPLGLIVLNEGPSPCTLEHKIYTAASLGVSFLVVVTPSHFYPRKLTVSHDPRTLANLTLLSVTSECSERLLDGTRYDDVGDDALLGLSVDAVGPRHDMTVVIDPMTPARQDFLLIPVALVALLVVWVFLPTRRVVDILMVPDPTSTPSLLTEEFVYSLCCSPAATREIIEDGCEPPACPICLEQFHLGSKVTVLPCGHPFDQDCILEWLTKRQSLCPICKYDLFFPSRREGALRVVRAGDSSTRESDSVAGLPAPSHGWPPFRSVFLVGEPSGMTANEIAHDLELTTFD